MNIQDLKKKFLLDDAQVQQHLDALVDKVRPFCAIDATGNVHFEPGTRTLKTRDKVFLALAARYIGAKLQIGNAETAEVADLKSWLGIPDNQLRARCNELLKESYIASGERGSFSVLPHRIEMYVDSLARVN